MKRGGILGAATIALPPGAQAWFAPVSGEGALSGRPWRAGEVWIVTGSEELAASEGSVVLFAYPGARRISPLLVPHSTTASAAIE